MMLKSYRMSSENNACPEINVNAMKYRYRQRIALELTKQGNHSIYEQMTKPTSHYFRFYRLIAKVSTVKVIQVYYEVLFAMQRIYIRLNTLKTSNAYVQKIMCSIFLGL